MRSLNGRPPSGKTRRPFAGGALYRSASLRRNRWRIGRCAVSGPTYCSAPCRETGSNSSRNSLCRRNSRTASSSAGWALARRSASPHRSPSTIAWRTSRIAPKHACRLCSARRISSAAIFSMGCAMHTGQRQPLSRTSLARRVPSGKSMRPSRAYFAYEAESKRSHPRRAARGKTSGWPAPNRWTGFAGSRPFFDAMITRTRSRNRDASRRGATSPYTWDWNAPESVMTAPGKPRNWWMPTRTIASRPGDFPRMYAFVIRICAPNRVARSLGGTIGRFGLTTGAMVGVATRPCAVSSTPIRASPSRSRISNMCGHRSTANKAFPRLRAPPRKGYASRAGSAPEHAPRDVRSHPGSGLPDRGAALAERNPHVGRFLRGIEAAPRARARPASHRGRDRPVRRGVAPRAASLLRAESPAPGSLARLARVRERNRLSGHRDDRAVDRSGRGDRGRSVRRTEETIVHPRRQPGRSSRGHGTRETPRHLQRLSLRRAVPSEGVPPDGPGPDPPRPRASAAATRIRRRPQGDRVAGRDPAERGDDGPRGLRRGAALARVRRGRWRRPGPTPRMRYGGRGQPGAARGAGVRGLAIVVPGWWVRDGRSTSATIDATREGSSEKPQLRATSDGLVRFRAPVRRRLHRRRESVEVHDLLGDLVLESRGDADRGQHDAGSKLSILERDMDGPEARSIELRPSPIPGRLRPLAVHEAQSLEFLDPAVACGDRNSEPATELDSRCRAIERSQ